MGDKIEKEIDESWKETAAQEKIILGNTKDELDSESKIIVNDFEKQEDEPVEAHEHDENCACGHDQDSESSDNTQEFELNFVNYITSLGFQIMIFLGEVPHPATNELEKNLDQAKMLIDTLGMLKDKTKGNLNEQEEKMLNASVYELQIKYVEIVKKEKSEA